MPIDNKILNLILEQNGIDIKNQTEVDSFLTPDYASIAKTYEKFKDMTVHACGQVESTILDFDGNICVYGDFDVDGITATSIMYRTLKYLGAKRCTYYIPDRVKENHGLNRSALTDIAARGTKLLITVDCGINQRQEVEYARHLGMDVIVTDHHPPGETPVIPHYDIMKPLCFVLTTPEELKTEFSGAGIAFKFAQALCTRHQKPYFAESLLWLACLGTIVDCVPQHNENRTICVLGMRQLNEKTPACIRAIALNSGMERPIEKKDITWNISPRLSSASRLQKKTAAEILMLPENDTKKIMEKANTLEMINDTRKEIVKKQLSLIIEDIVTKHGYIVVVMDKTAHSVGIQGLLASMLCSQHNQTAFVFTDVGDGILHGSCRANSECNITEVIRLAHEKNLLIEGGGHVAAGGLSMYIENLQDLKEIINQGVHSLFMVGEKPTIPIPLPGNEINMDLFYSLRTLDPYPDGDSPLFSTIFILGDDAKQIGSDKSHLSFNVRYDQNSFRVLAFGKGHRIQDFSDLPSGQQVKVIYRLMLNTWQNKRDLELQAEDFIML